MFSLVDLEQRFGTEEACRDHLVRLRWPDGVHCVRCGSPKVYRVRARWAWQCKTCSHDGYRFSPLVGTIFENTSFPLTAWFRAIFLMCQSRPGLSAVELQRLLGCGSYRTSWYLCQRVRVAMRDQGFQTLLGVARVGEALAGNPTVPQGGPGR